MSSKRIGTFSAFFFLFGVFGVLYVVLDLISPIEAPAGIGMFNMMVWVLYFLIQEWYKHVFQREVDAIKARQAVYKARQEEIARERDRQQQELLRECRRASREHREAATRAFQEVQVALAMRRACRLLGVRQGVGDVELKAAWRRAAKRWHPDVCDEPGAREKFRDCKRAFELLRTLGE